MFTHPMIAAYIGLGGAIILAATLHQPTIVTWAAAIIMATQMILIYRTHRYLSPGLITLTTTWVVAGTTTHTSWHLLVSWIGLPAAALCYLYEWHHTRRDATWGKTRQPI